MSQDCIEWTKYIDKQTGYGRLRRGGVVKWAHRAAWEDTCGAIPKGMHVLHKCDNRSCVNPNHLFLGTHRDNMKDMVEKGRNFIAAGTLNGNSKHTLEQIRQIMHLLLVGNLTQTEIEKMFGIEQCQVSAIKLGRAWAHADRRQLAV